MSDEQKEVAVEGSPYLRKNLDSNCIINTNMAEIEAARQRKRIRQQEKKKKAAMENELVELREQVAQLTQLVKDMVK